MKPLKDTKLGKFLASKGLDHLLEGIGTVLPGVKVLDQIKDAVLGDSGRLSEEDKKEFMELYKLRLEELDKSWPTPPAPGTARKNSWLLQDTSTGS
jgi:hypothetical protein